MESIGRFRIAACLHRDPTVTVHRAWSVDGQEVLLLTPSSDEAHPAFCRRLHTLLELSHPAIAPIREADAQGPLPFAVVATPGHTLAERVAGRALPAPEAVTLAARLCGALCHAHHRGVVHGALSPAWIGCDVPGQEVLVFGPSLQAGHDQAGAFAAPERRAGMPADERTDVYGVGALLYAMLTGQPPATLEGDTQQRPQPPRSFIPNLHPNLDALVMRCLEPDPACRYATCQDLALALYYHLSSPEAAFAPREVAPCELTPDADPPCHLEHGHPWSPGRPLRVALTPAGFTRVMGWAAWLVVVALFVALLVPVARPGNAEAAGISAPLAAPVARSGPSTPATLIAPASPSPARSPARIPALPARLPAPPAHRLPAFGRAPLPPVARVAWSVRETPSPPGPEQAAPQVMPVALASREAEPKPVAAADGRLLVTAAPDRCAVYLYIDGGDTRGRCPLEVTLPPGQHAVSLWDPEHRAQRDLQIELAPGQELTLHEELHGELPPPPSGTGSPHGDDAIAAPPIP